MHHVLTHIEEAVENSEVTCVAFLDIERAFDSNSFYITTKATEQLGHRSVYGLVPYWVAWDCQQWDVLLSLLPNLVVDKLIGGLNENGCYSVACR